MAGKAVEGRNGAECCPGREGGAGAPCTPTARIERRSSPPAGYLSLGRITSASRTWSLCVGQSAKTCHRSAGTLAVQSWNAGG